MKFFKLVLASILVLMAFAVQAEHGVSRATITSAIEEREPVDQIAELANDVSKIYFFTEIKGMEGHTLIHRWQKDGEVMADVSFTIGGNRWRVWSSKNLLADALGEWTVTVVDEGGKVLATETFNYIAVVAEAESVEPEKSVNTSAAE